MKAMLLRVGIDKGTDGALAPSNLKRKDYLESRDQTRGAYLLDLLRMKKRYPITKDAKTTIMGRALIKILIQDSQKIS